MSNILSVKKIEKTINSLEKKGHIQKAIEVELLELPIEKAREMGATGIFENKYGEVVKVYKIGDVSMEMCGGPHAKNTSELGTFKIAKEESSSAGVRRIKAVLKRTNNNQ